MTVPIQVRYVECDPMKVAHHSSYLTWMELARCEMLRRDGMSYAECEAAGIFFVVARLQVRYRKPAYYDDQLDIAVICESAGKVSIEHSYRLLRDEELLAEATTTLVCVNGDGQPQAIPANLLGK